MTTRENIVITFEKRTYSSHGYTQTEVCIREMYQIAVRDKLAGTVDNRDGYGSQEACEWWAKVCKTLLDEHQKFMYEPVIGGLSIRLRWQHYEQTDDGMTYCDVDFEDLGRRFCQIEKAVKFLRRLGQKNSGIKGRTYFDTPENVVETLSAMKFISVVGQEKHRASAINVEHRRFDPSLAGTWTEPCY